MALTPSVALSGVLCADQWVTDPAEEILLIQQAGFTRIEIPFWRIAGNVYPGGYTLAAVVGFAKGLGLSVDLVPHNDGASAASYQYEPITSPTTFLAWLTGVLTGVVLGPNDSVSWWNEISPQNSGDWSPLSALYGGLGNKIHQLVKSLGAKSVAPVPMSQTPEDARQFLDGMLNPQDILSPDAWNVHLYKDDLTSSDINFTTLQGQFNAIAALIEVTEKPVIIGEAGGGIVPISPTAGSTPLPLVMDSAFIAQSVALAKTLNIQTFTGWQWIDNGDHLRVKGWPAVISALLS